MSIEEERVQLENFPFPLLLVVSLHKMIDHEKWEAVYGLLPRDKDFPALLQVADEWPVGKKAQKVDLAQKNETDSGEEEAGAPGFPSIDQKTLEDVILAKGFFNIGQQINNRMNMQAEAEIHGVFRGRAYFRQPSVLCGLPLPSWVNGVNSLTPSNVPLPFPFVQAKFKYQAVLARKTARWIDQFSDDLAQPGADEASSVFGALVPRYQAWMTEHALSWDNRFPLTGLPDWEANAFAAFGNLFFPQDPWTNQRLTLDVIEPIIDQWRAAGVWVKKNGVEKGIKDWLTKLRQVRDGLFRLGVMYWHAKQSSQHLEPVTPAVAPWLAQLLYAWDDEGDIAVTPLPSSPVIVGLADALKKDPRRRASRPYEAHQLPCSKWSAYYDKTQNESAHANEDVLVVIAEAHPDEKSDMVKRLIGRTQVARAGKEGGYDQELAEAWGEQLLHLLWEARTDDHRNWRRHMIGGEATRVVSHRHDQLQALLDDKKRSKPASAIERQVQDILGDMMQIWTDFLVKHALTWEFLLPPDATSPDPRVLAIEQYLLNTRDEDGNPVPVSSSDAYRQGLTWRLNQLNANQGSDA